MKEGLHPSLNQIFLSHVQRMSQARQAHQHSERNARTPIIKGQRAEFQFRQLPLDQRAQPVQLIPMVENAAREKEIVFSAGMIAGTPAELVEQYRKNLQEVLLAVYNVEVPTIAAVNGSAVGAGCGLALMCDLRVASRQATFGETFLNVGLIPGDGSAYTLPRVIGMARASELIFTAETIDADTALALGLVNHVVAHEELLAKAQQVAKRIAGRPPQATRLTKKLLRRGVNATLEESMFQASAYQALCHFTDDHMEALNAMFEKRKPSFQGK